MGLGTQDGIFQEWSTGVVDAMDCIEEKKYSGNNPLFQGGEKRCVDVLE
jgi:hypothetical protein